MITDYTKIHFKVNKTLIQENIQHEYLPNIAMATKNSRQVASIAMMQPNDMKHLHFQS